MKSSRSPAVTPTRKQGAGDAGRGKISSGGSGRSPASSAGSSRTGSGSHTSSAGSAPGSAGRSRTIRPSDKLNPKTVDPFSAVSKNQSAFATLYTTGGVPCRLVHGSVKHKLSWDIAPEEAHFDPVLVTLAEGIRETIHPYFFVARQGFKELLQVADAGDRTRPLVPKLVLALRAALGNADPGVFAAGLDALLQLSSVVGPALNSHLKTVLVPVSKKAMDKKFKEKVNDGLQQLELNGGREALLLIKSKVPTYMSVTS